MTRVLVLNTRSSSVKWTVLAADKTVLDGGSEPWAAEDSVARAGQLRAALARAPAFDAAGHRVVHGGTRFREAVVIDESVREELAGLSDLDPEHMHASLAGIDAVSAAFPAVPQVAAFDTAFHATLPEAAAGRAALVDPGGDTTDPAGHVCGLMGLALTGTDIGPKLTVKSLPEKRYLTSTWFFRCGRRPSAHPSVATRCA